MFLCSCVPVFLCPCVPVFLCPCVPVSLCSCVPVFLCVPGVQEDELHIQTGSEHEHVAVQLDLGDSAGWERVAHCHQPHVLVAAVEQRHVQAVLPDLQVAAAVNHLEQEQAQHPHKHTQGLYKYLFIVCRIYFQTVLEVQEKMCCNFYCLIDY